MRLFQKRNGKKIIPFIYFLFHWKNVCSKCGFLSRQSIVNKVTWLKNSLRVVIETKSESRKGFTTQYHTFQIKQILEKAKTKNTELGLLELKKWHLTKCHRESLEQRGVNKNLRNGIKNLYESGSIIVVNFY